MDTHIPAYPAETIKAFDARQDPCSATRYVLSIDLTIESNIGEIARHGLWRLSSGVLFDQNTRIYIKEWRETIVTGCHVDPTQSGPHAIKGLFKTPYASPSHPREAVSLAIVDTAERRGTDTVFEASIRIMPGGWRDRIGRLHKENAASRRLFEEFGFINHGKPNAYQFIGDFRDQHLLESLEPDGRTYRNQTMRSTARTLELARAYLAYRRKIYGASS